MLALAFISNGNISGATTAIMIAFVMDFFDGFTARLLKVSSPIGKELDSLADMVTFGAVPGFIMGRLIQESFGKSFLPEQIFMGEDFPWFLVGFLIPVFSALRLAKFNIDERQGDAFYGLNTPTNTGLILSFWLITELKPDFWLAELLNHSFIWIGLSIVCSFLLVADVRMLALKFKNYSVRDNLYRYILMVASLVSLIIFQYVAIPFLLVLYFVLSFLDNIQNPPKAVK